MDFENWGAVSKHWTLLFIHGRAVWVWKKVYACEFLRVWVCVHAHRHTWDLRAAHWITRRKKHNCSLTDGEILKRAGPGRLWASPTAFPPIPTYTHPLHKHPLSILSWVTQALGNVVLKAWVSMLYQLGWILGDFLKQSETWHWLEVEASPTGKGRLQAEPILETGISPWKKFFWRLYLFSY